MEIKTFVCPICNIEFQRNSWDYNRKAKRNRTLYCSKQCSYKGLVKLIDVKCLQCDKHFQKQPVRISKNNFCSRSCSVRYNNTHKTKGTRRSKLELYIESKLKELYPELSIIFNDKTTINSELDIYIPNLNLAFELNGIFHYEPIYGQEKLSQVQNNDDRKFQACLEHGISLCIIDTSSQKYFKESSSQKFLDIIKTTIQRASSRN